MMISSICALASKAGHRCYSASTSFCPSSSHDMQMLMSMISVHHTCIYSAYGAITITLEEQEQHHPSLQHELQLEWTKQDLMLTYLVNDCTCTSLHVEQMQEWRMCEAKMQNTSQCVVRESVVLMLKERRVQVVEDQGHALP